MNLVQLKRWVQEEGECWVYVGPEELDWNLASRATGGRDLPVGKRVRTNCGSPTCIKREHWDLVAGGRPEFLEPKLVPIGGLVFKPKPEFLEEKVRLCRKGHRIEGVRCKTCHNEYQAEHKRSRRSL